MSKHTVLSESKHTVLLINDAKGLLKSYREMLEPVLQDENIKLICADSIASIPLQRLPEIGFILTDDNYGYYPVETKDEHELENQLVTSMRNVRGGARTFNYKDHMDHMGVSLVKYIRAGHLDEEIPNFSNIPIGIYSGGAPKTSDAWVFRSAAMYDENTLCTLIAHAIEVHETCPDMPFAKLHQIVEQSIKEKKNLQELLKPYLLASAQELHQLDARIDAKKIKNPIGYDSYVPNDQDYLRALKQLAEKREKKTRPKSSV